MKKLLLASKSPSRRLLLDQAEIPYRVIEQNADEHEISWAAPAEKLVLDIARHKMKHAVIPCDADSVVWVVTADTLTQDADGIIYGKPASKEEAVANIKKFRESGIVVATGLCVTRFKRDAQSGEYKPEASYEETVVSRCTIDLSDYWLKTFFERQPIALQAAGGIALEGYGMPFLKSVDGSLTNIIGLPLCELRQALEKLEFYS